VALAFGALTAMACDQTVDGVKYEWDCGSDVCGNLLLHQLSGKITKGTCIESDGSEKMVNAEPTGF
jgi:hypothetical protein